MKRINLSSLLAGISLITLSLVTLSVPTYASTPKDADASDLTAPLASRSASPATSDDEGDEVEEADPRIVKLETQLKEQDTYFAGKLKTMTATTYALRKEVRTLTDALEEQKRLAAQQQAALTKAASVSPADNGAASAAPAAALSNAAEQDKILDLQTQLAAQKALVATAVSENDTLTATLTTRQFEFDTLSQQHALLKGLYGPCATQNTELAIQLKAVTGERDAHAETQREVHTE